MGGSIMASMIERTQHAAERKVFEKLIDSIVGKLQGADSDEARTKVYLQLIDKAQKFWGSSEDDKEKFEYVKEYVKNPNNRWVKFINRVLDETNPQYARKFLLNLGLFRR